MSGKELIGKTVRITGQEKSGKALGIITERVVRKIGIVIDSIESKSHENPYYKIEFKTTKEGDYWFFLECDFKVLD